MPRFLPWIVFLRFKSCLFTSSGLFKNRAPQKAVAQITLMCFVFSLTLSCASSPPARVSVKKDQLSKYTAVALNVSCPELDVRYSREGDVSVIGGAILVACVVFASGFVTALVTESLIQSSADSKNTEGFNKALGENQFERLLGNYFLDQFTKVNLFKKLNYTAHGDNHKALVAEGFDSIIKLKIEDFCLKRVIDTNLLNLRVGAVAKMIDLQNEQVIWSQYEVVISDDKHTIDEYKADGAKILIESVDKSLRKIGSRLAWDIMYSK